MADTEGRVSPDKRIQERALRKGETSAAVSQEAAASARDYGESLEAPASDELEKLRDELVEEKKLRDERIERSKNRPNIPTPPRTAVAPLDDEL